MEFYICDSNFNKSEVIQKWTSAIWTDRYSKTGDFQLEFALSEKPANLLEGSFIREADSIEAGIVDTIEYDNEKVIVTGEFLPGFLRNRVIRVIGSGPDGTANTFTPNSTPEYAMLDVMFYFCTADGLAINVPSIQHKDREAFTKLDVIDQFMTTPTTPAIQHAVPIGTVYDGMVYLAEPAGIGWRFYPTSSPSDYILNYEYYKGLDRSKDQSTNSVVMFEPSLDSLINTKEIHSIAAYKTVAHTFAPNIDPSDWGYNPADIVGYATVPGLDTALDFDRRTMFVNYDDLTVEDYAGEMVKLWNVLNQRAKDLLVNNNYVRVLDGEIVPQMQYTYGVDYNMGDIISLKGIHNTYQKARVTEYIRSQDATGYKAYPTLSVVEGS